MNTVKQYVLLILCLLSLCPLMACEQPEDEPGPGPGGGGYQRCIDSPTTEVIQPDGYFYYQYCDGCCWKAGEGFNGGLEAISITKSFRPGTFCCWRWPDPGTAYGRTPCGAMTDDPGCSNCTGGGTGSGGGNLGLTKTQRSALLAKYPDLEWAIEQGFLIPERQ